MAEMLIFLMYVVDLERQSTTWTIFIIRSVSFETLCDATFFTYFKFQQPIYRNSMVSSGFDRKYPEIVYWNAMNCIVFLISGIAVALSAQNVYGLSSINQTHIPNGDGSGSSHERSKRSGIYPLNSGIGVSESKNCFESFLKKKTLFFK